MEHEKGFQKGLRIDLQKAQVIGGRTYATFQIQWGTGQDGKMGGSYAGAQILETPDGIKILAVATHHGDAPAVAYRIEYSAKSVTFSGDIDPQGLENLTKLATDTDLLVFNCAVLDPPGSPAELYARHSPPKRIGEIAKASGAHHLILTHIPPLVDKARTQVSASIRAADQGTVQFAEDKMRVTVQ